MNDLFVLCVSYCSYHVLHSKIYSYDGNGIGQVTWFSILVRVLVDAEWIPEICPIPSYFHHIADTYSTYRHESVATLMTETHLYHPLHRMVVI
jgi:hypothetical protein